MNPTAAAVLDAISLLEQSNTLPGTWHAVIDLENAFCPSLSLRPNRTLYDIRELRVKTTVRYNHTSI